MSEPQIAAVVTRTIASLGCSMRGIGFSSTRTRYGPRYTIACIAAPSVLREVRDAAALYQKGNSHADAFTHRGPVSRTQNALYLAAVQQIVRGVQLQQMRDAFFAAFRVHANAL